MLNKFEIPKRAQACAGNGEKIGPGMHYYSCLMVNEASETIRQDYCPACWQNRKEAEGFISKGFWRSVVDAKEPVVVAPRIEQALVLLRSLIALEEEHADEIFVLALYLCHAKKLVLRKEFQEEGALWGLYEEPKKEEFFKIKSFPLTALETSRLQSVLSEKLGSK